MTYDEENVKLFELSKETGFLTLVPTGYGAEEEHLRPLEGPEKQEKIALANQMKKEGKNNSEIGRALDVSEGTIRNWLKT
jgi:DNA-binding NarL/FixJ family response regulator